jgi:hypothetical protein
LGFKTKEELWQKGQRKSQPAMKRVVVMLSSKSRKGKLFPTRKIHTVLLYPHASDTPLANTIEFNRLIGEDAAALALLPKETPAAEQTLAWKFFYGISSTSLGLFF